MEQAKVDNKPIMAVFSGSDWSKLCQLLKQEVLEQPEFEQYAKDTFVLARFDFPRSKKNALSAEQATLNAAAAAQLNLEGNFPLVLLSPEGNVLANTSYWPGGPRAYGAYLNQLLAHR